MCWDLVSYPSPLPSFLKNLGSPIKVVPTSKEGGCTDIENFTASNYQVLSSPTQWLLACFREWRLCLQEFGGGLDGGGGVLRGEGRTMKRRADTHTHSLSYTLTERDAHLCHWKVGHLVAMATARRRTWAQFKIRGHCGIIRKIFLTHGPTRVGREGWIPSWLSPQSLGENIHFHSPYLVPYLPGNTGEQPTWRNNSRLWLKVGPCLQLLALWILKDMFSSPWINLGE